MDKSKDSITVKLGINDNTKRIEVVYLVKALVLCIHFFIDTVNRLDSTLECMLYSALLKLIYDHRANTFDKVKALSVFLFNVVLNLIEAVRVKVLKA